MLRQSAEALAYVKLSDSGNEQEGTVMLEEGRVLAKRTNPACMCCTAEVVQTITVRGSWWRPRPNSSGCGPTRTEQLQTRGLSHAA